MGRIGTVVSSTAFQERLERARGQADVLMIYRTSTGGRHHHGDGGSPEMLQECIDEIAEAAGMEVGDANVFASEPRTTLTIKFPIQGTESDIAVYHDTRRGITEYQIIHCREVTVRHGSHSDLMLAFAEPGLLLDAHFGQEQAGAVRRLLESLELQVRPPSSGELEYDSHTLNLDPR